MIEILAVAVALGTDAFSVAVALGTRCFRLFEIIKISFIIGIFHIFMPLIGYFGSNYIKKIIWHFTGTAGNLNFIFEIIGAGLLLLIGFYMLIEKNMENDECISTMNISGWGIIAIASSVSIDALTVGISLGMIGFALSSVLIFGVVAGLMMAVGLILGSKIGNWFGDKAQIFGGIGLILIGLRFAGIL